MIQTGGKPGLAVEASCTQPGVLVLLVVVSQVCTGSQSGVRYTTTHLTSPDTSPRPLGAGIDTFRLVYDSD